MRVHEALYELEPFCEFFANLLALRVIHRLLKLNVQLAKLDLRQENLDRLRTHPRHKSIAILFLRFPVLLFI